MLNKTQLIGRLGNDPDYRCTASGTPMATFSLATSERFKGKDGETQEFTEWHTIVAWRNLADTCRKYLAKGSLVYVEGKIRKRKYQDKDGKDRSITEIMADQVKFLDRAENGSNDRPRTEEEPF
ncbi:MAG: single-stranded DNA-binding protein [Desulfuromonadaceae bacterium]|nr:single-stranded DNA-binding protein [Desulfuromonadaceae bacterium]